MKPRLFSLLALLLVLPTARADHYAGGSITTRCTGGNFYEVTLQLFRNCTGSALIDQTLNYTNDCGVVFQQTLTSPISVVGVSPLCAAELPNSSCNGGSLIGFELATFQTTVYLSPCTNWRIAWDICCRPTSLNVVSTPGMYMETVLNNADSECNYSPVFTQDIIPTVCVGQQVGHDASAVGDPTHRLSYHLIDARFGSPAPLPLNYASGFSGEQPFTGMSIDTISGEITFQATAAGSIITAVEVREFDGDEMIGTVMRDFLFVVTNCNNTLPATEGGTFVSADGVGNIMDARTIRACGSGAFCATLEFTDVDEAQQLSITTDIATQLPGATLDVTGSNPLVATLCWDSEGLELGNYPFFLRASDGACPIPGSRRYDYSILVDIAPFPGEDSSTQVCENGSEVDLFSALGGTPEGGGSWTDPQGQAASGIFTPSTSSAGGYTYTATGSNGCTANAIVAVEVLPASTPNCVDASVDEHALNDIRLFVDGSSGRLNIVCDRGLDLDLHLLALDGREVWNTRTRLGTGSNKVLDTPTDLHGVFVLRVHDRATDDHRALRILMP